MERKMKGKKNYLEGKKNKKKQECVYIFFILIRIVAGGGVGAFITFSLNSASLPRDFLSLCLFSYIKQKQKKTSRKFWNHVPHQKKTSEYVLQNIFESD
jgi:hypothetical protein